MGSLGLKGITKSFGAVDVLKGIDLDVADGEFVIFVGPSGCGKSTLLRIIAGLDDATSGSVTIDGREVNAIPPARRGIAMVFQSYALYPHLNVRGNMELGLRHARMPRAEIESKVGMASDMLSLQPYMKRYPAELSGGQRQRVAIGRAVVREPKLFLFDEPLSNLDAALRVNTRLEIAKLHRDLDATMIYVTHDQTEAMTLADRIVVMNAGRVEQVGTPMDLYRDPANVFVATFIGSPQMNLIDGARIGRRDAATIGIRPEHLRIVAGGSGFLQGRIEHLERLGADTIAYLETAAGPLTVRAFGEFEHEPGANVSIEADEPHIFGFDASGQRLRQTQGGAS